ncbi:MAG: 6-phosphogluconolactonase [Deltaproteobacteria bacterium]|nr:6-phosphogluconolactonase [Deltaproteobacteria bacterium]
MGDSLDISFLLSGGELGPAEIDRLRSLDLEELRGALATYLGEEEIDDALDRIRSILAHPAALPEASEDSSDADGAVEISVLADPEEVATRAAELVEELAKAAIAARGRFALALSGGSTPKLLHAALATRNLPWPNILVLFSDERAVRHDHPDSNFKMALETLIGPGQVPLESVFRIEADDGDAKSAAASYETRLTELLGPEGIVDAVILGMGEDGHTASLFPGAQVEMNLVVATEAPPKSPVSARVSFSYEALRKAREAIVLITGENKAERTAEVLSGESDLPIARVLSSRSRSRVFCDRAAASGLGKR